MDMESRLPVVTTLRVCGTAVVVWTDRGRMHVQDCASCAYDAHTRTLRVEGHALSDAAEAALLDASTGFVGDTHIVPKEGTVVFDLGFGSHAHQVEAELGAHVLLDHGVLCLSDKGSSLMATDCARIDVGGCVESLQKAAVASAVFVRRVRKCAHVAKEEAATRPPRTAACAGSEVVDALWLVHVERSWHHLINRCDTAQCAHRELPTGEVGWVDADTFLPAGLVSLRVCASDGGEIALRQHPVAHHVWPLCRRGTPISVETLHVHVVGSAEVYFADAVAGTVLKRLHAESSGDALIGVCLVGDAEVTGRHAKHGSCMLLHRTTSYEYLLYETASAIRADDADEPEQRMDLPAKARRVDAEATESARAAVRLWNQCVRIDQAQKRRKALAWATPAPPYPLDESAASSSPKPTNATASSIA